MFRQLLRWKITFNSLIWFDVIVIVQAQCPTLTAPVYGQTSTCNNQIGSQCHFKCLPGYDPIGSCSRTCTSSGQWTGQEMFCIDSQVICPFLNTTSNALVRLVGGCLSLAGSRCKFTCPPDHQLAGADTLTCLNTGTWSASLPTCVTGTPTCTALAHPPNGQVDSRCTISGLPVGTTCFYTCSSGYRLIGNDSLQCQPSGQWSASAPSCDRLVGCTALNIPNGLPLSGTECSGQLVAIGSTCTIQCLPGFTLIGQPNVYCLSGGQWSAPIASCSNTVAGCIPFQVPNGQLSGDQCLQNMLIPTGSVCQITCYNGYLLVGDAQLACLSSNQWSNAIPSCQLAPIGCQPLNIANARISGFGCTGNFRVAFNSTCIVSCVPGYSLSGISTLVCDINNNWNNPPPVCNPRPNSCASISAAYPLQSTGTCDQATAGSVCNFSCANGFILQGQSQLICQFNGQWNSNVPFCVQRSCPAVKAPFGGIFVDSCPGNNGICSVCPGIPGQFCTLICGDGFKLIGSDNKFYCTNNTFQWQPQPLPSCELINANI